MEEDEIKKPIVIAGKPIKDLLMVVAFEAMKYDEIKLSFTDNHTSKAEDLLKILRKAYGWIEIDRKKVTTENKKCVWENEESKCTNPEICKNNRLSCKIEMRGVCKGYKQKYNNLFIANEVTIEKVGGARGL